MSRTDRFAILASIAGAIAGILFSASVVSISNGYDGPDGAFDHQTEQSSTPPPTEAEMRPATTYASLEALEEYEGQQDYENEKIQAALMKRAEKIDDCTITWYTAGTCGKRPGDPTYGITASGLPVVEHLTCATDPSVIPMYSDVFVQYADGTIEQLWATDTGVHGNHVEIYIESYDEAIQNGRHALTVWFVPPEGCD